MYALSSQTHLHIGRELLQGLVKVVHLSDDAHDDDDKKRVGWRMSKLIVSSKC